MQPPLVSMFSYAFPRSVRGALVLGLLVLAACSSGSELADRDDAAASSTTALDDAVTTTTTALEDTATTTVAPETTVSEAEQDEAEQDEVCGVAVSVLFNESAPRDSMTVINESIVDVSFTTVVFDLTSSAGGIIFDTLDGGAGVEVFQGFQYEAGDAILAQDPVAEDGASSLRLDFDEFSSGQSFTFSIDVDDQLTDSDLGQIQVTGSEMAGAQILLTTGGGDDVVAVFGDADSAQFSADC